MDESPLVVVKTQPFNAETPPTALAPGATPTPLFYVRTNFAPPSVAAEDWRLTVGGAVARPLTLDLAALHALPSRTLPVTLECAGNDRIGLQPLPEGEPWGGGAVSTGIWRGTPLARVLAHAGLGAGVVEVLFTGADSGARAGHAGPVPYARALAPADALAPDVLLAYELNGAALPAAHGGPVRLLVPGWYGMASVKWLAGITALTAPFSGHFQTERYVYHYPDTGEIVPVDRIRVKARITAPVPGAVLAAGPQQISGLAWAGAGPVARVEVSVEGGGAWQPAHLGDPPDSPYAWQPWTFAWTPTRPGRHVLRARATDAAGTVQPDAARWNRLGYGNNSVQVVVVDVA
ncbi:MAG TPA: sulfite oxidase [Chloroflexia bacterium]|nr:sulfite oxidase [Chloroflexia bacterium]